MNQDPLKVNAQVVSDNILRLVPDRAPQDHEQARVDGTIGHTAIRALVALQDMSPVELPRAITPRYTAEQQQRISEDFANLKTSIIDVEESPNVEMRAEKVRGLDGYTDGPNFTAIPDVHLAAKASLVGLGSDGNTARTHYNDKVRSQLQAKGIVAGTGLATIDALANEVAGAVMQTAYKTSERTGEQRRMGHPDRLRQVLGEISALNLPTEQDRPLEITARAMLAGFAEDKGQGFKELEDFVTN